MCRSQRRWGVVGMLIQGLGFVLFGIGVAIVGWNFYFGVATARSPGRCVLLIGSLALWLAAFLLRAYPALRVAALILSFFDAAGPIWYAGLMLSELAI